MPEKIDVCLLLDTHHRTLPDLLSAAANAHVQNYKETSCLHRSHRILNNSS